MSDDSKGREGSATFVDQLRDIQGEYLMLSELYEKERNYGHKLADTMRLLQYEVDVTIPIDKDFLSDGGIPLKEAFLASESVVIMVDENDNKISRPLDRFPPDVILSIIQDCTPELKRLISERRRNVTLKVSSLEKVLRELKKAQATFKQTKGESVDEEEDQEPEVEEQKEDVSRPEQRAPVTAKAVIRGRDKQDEAFAFRASFLEKREADENAAKA